MPASARCRSPPACLLNHILNVKPTSVPFNGTGPALTALIAGQVDYMCDQIVNVVQQIHAGQIKAYAIGTPARSRALPNVPTAKEAGLPDFEAQAWNALFAPKDTPKPIVDKLSAALDKALDDEGTRKRLLELGSVLPDKTGRTPAGAAGPGEERDRALDADHPGGRPGELNSRAAPVSRSLSGRAVPPAQCFAKVSVVGYPPNR